MINRGVIILRPAQPFLDWAASLGCDDVLPNMDGEQTVYLIPEWGDDREKERVLQRVFAVLFEQELFSWHTDESAWPKVRGLREFKGWFHVEMHSLVVDLVDGEIYDDDV